MDKDEERRIYSLHWALCIAELAIEECSKHDTCIREESAEKALPVLSALRKQVRALDLRPPLTDEQLRSIITEASMELDEFALFADLVL